MVLRNVTLKSYEPKDMASSGQSNRVDCPCADITVRYEYTFDAGETWLENEFTVNNSDQYDPCDFVEQVTGAGGGIWYRFENGEWHVYAVGDDVHVLKYTARPCESGGSSPSSSLSDVSSKPEEYDSSVDYQCACAEIHVHYEFTSDGGATWIDVVDTVNTSEQYDPCDYRQQVTTEGGEIWCRFENGEWHVYAVGSDVHILDYTVIPCGSGLSSSDSSYIGPLPPVPASSSYTPESSPSSSSPSSSSDCSCIFIVYKCNDDVGKIVVCGSGASIDISCSCESPVIQSGSNPSSSQSRSSSHVDVGSSDSSGSCSQDDDVTCDGDCISPWHVSGPAGGADLEHRGGVSWDGVTPYGYLRIERSCGKWLIYSLVFEAAVVGRADDLDLGEVFLPSAFVGVSLRFTRDSVCYSCPSSSSLYSSSSVDSDSEVVVANRTHVMRFATSREQTSLKPQEEDKKVDMVPVVDSDYKFDYGKIDYGMPRRCAFAIHAEGEKYIKFRDNLTSKIRWHVPGIDIVDIDMSEAKEHLPGICQDKLRYFSRLAIPLMRQFEKYDRVIYMDVDIDVISGMFAGVLSVETGEDGVAAAQDSFQKFYRKHVNEDVRPGRSVEKYFNSGLIVFDLYKIDRGKWKSSLYDGLSEYSRRMFRWPDQDLLNGWFDVREIDQRYNYLWIRKNVEKDGPYAIHYCNKRGTRELLDRISGSDVSIDAVFVIGTGSKNGNEELRYALRNMDANCKFVRRVYICGECPDWVDKSAVTHLPWPDRFRHAKDANIIDKLRHACESDGIAKRILFCSDDQFQTRPCSWDDFYPRYLRKYDPSDSWYADRKREWHNRLRATLERDLKRRIDSGMDAGGVYYWQPHIWMPIDRDRFIEYAKWSDYEHRKDTIIASGYFNFIGAKPISNRDHAFIGNVDRMPDVTHIAYTDGAGYESAMKWLKKKFPHKCRFEVGDDQNDHSEFNGSTMCEMSGVEAVKTAMLQRFD